MPPVKYEIALSMDGTQLVVYYTIGGYYYPLSTTYAELLPQKFWMADSLADMQTWIKEIDAAASSELNSDTSQFAAGSFSDSSAVISYTAPSDIWDAASDVSDIVSAPDYYYHFGGIEEPVTAYYGEGFTCIRFAFGDYLFTAVEDYRDHTFTLYYGDGFSNLNGVSIYQSVEYPAIDSFRKTLASGASQAKTRALFGFLPSDTAPFDYAELYTNGELDEGKTADRVQP